MKAANKEKLSDRQEQLATRVAGHIVAKQRSIADWLNHRTEGFTAHRWLLLLGIFCLGIGSYCFWLLLEAFN